MSLPFKVSSYLELTLLFVISFFILCVRTRPCDKYVTFCGDYCHSICKIAKEFPMALTSSNMLELGTPAPSFSLLDVVSGGVKTDIEVFGEEGTVVMFICNHCPYVLHVNPELCRLADDYQKKGIGFVAISSNDAEQYPQDGPVPMKAHAAEQGYPFPYLYDEQQDVARAYQAACTPDIYVFDSNRALYYRGRIDASRPGQSELLSGKDLRSAINALLAGSPPPARQYPSAGCNIKWK